MLCAIWLSWLAACGGGGSDGLTSHLNNDAARAGSTAVVTTPLASVPASLLTTPSGSGSGSASVRGASDKVRISYVPSQALLANPERGFYTGVRRCDRDAFNVGTLAASRNRDGTTLVICIFYLNNFKDTALDDDTLAFFQRQMDAIRAAGMKAILRFAYTEDMRGDDVPVDQVVRHLDQLTPYLARNSDVIFVLQHGFVGAWGEGAYSRNFGNANKLTAKNIADRRTVLAKILQVMPTSRMVQVRTPQLKRSLYGHTPLQASEAFSGSDRARIGEHNDCFLNGDGDAGTYSDRAAEYPYLSAETTYLPMGGETCGLSPPRTDCPTALNELSRFHWTYLNLNYDTRVLERWRAQGCFNQIRQSLGYRLVLQNGSYSSQAQPGGAMEVRLTLNNVGWAAPVNRRGVDLVLRRGEDGRLYRFRLDTDVRQWLPGKTISIQQSIVLPASMPSGRYELLLNLPDAAPALAPRPEYAIAFANEQMWEAGSGMNALAAELVVGN